MTAFNWTIETCEYEVATGGITVAHWRVSVVDGTYSATAYGSVGLTPDVTDPSFKPYDQVTQDEVLSWVWGQLDKEELESSLQNSVDSQKAPKIASGTPWGL
jgi:hypothetical protein